MGRRHDLRNRITYTNPALRVMAAPLVAASSNWWEIAGETCVAAYQPKGAASQSASYSNLANPGTYDAAPGTAPGWDSTNGWDFTKASSTYLTTGVVPATDGSYSLIVRFSGGDTNTGILAGCAYTADTPDYFFLVQQRNAGGLLVYGNGTNATAGSSSATSGVLAVAGQYGYLNGTQDASGLNQTLTAIGSRAIVIGAMYENSGPANHFNGNIQAVAIYSTTLDGTQISSLTSAMNAL